MVFTLSLLFCVMVNVSCECDNGGGNTWRKRMEMVLAMQHNVCGEGFSYQEYWRSNTLSPADGGSTIGPAEQSPEQAILPAL
jgi:hypothetical protein